MVTVMTRRSIKTLETGKVPIELVRTSWLLRFPVSVAACPTLRDALQEPRGHIDLPGRVRLLTLMLFPILYPYCDRIRYT
ncbi:hypothetical protein AU476_03145 [Cupriavidus sp. UYMSc13B]|nr:hypothetical protein AU476_03145 [Cupriavidus sp. UYMSc13B]